MLTGRAASAITVRRATPADAAFVNELASSTLQQVNLGDELALSQTRAWVAESRGVPVAFAIAWFVADEVELQHIATAETARRLGAGRALMTQVVRAAEQAEACQIVLETRRSNSQALALYRAFGFDAVSVRHAYYSEPPEDGIQMLRALTPQAEP